MRGMILSFLLAGQLMGSSICLAFEGTETLGPPAIPIAPGTDILIGGVGLKTGQPDSISLAVPAGVTVQQVIAYWEGQAATAGEQGATDTIFMNGMPVMGVRIGGPTNWPVSTPVWTSSYRADVTALGLVAPGVLNVVSVDGLDFVTANNGAGLLVIVDDGVNTSDVQVLDGNDTAFVNFAPPLKDTMPVTFNFAASTSARTATLSYFVGSVALMRPNVITIAIDGIVSEVLVDALGNLSGPEWDSLQHSFNVPAGATSITTQLLSMDGGGPYTGNLPASMVWVAGGLSIPETVTTGGGEGCTPGYWKNHTNRWDGVGLDDFTTNIHTFDLFNTVFGVTPIQSQMGNSQTLLDAVNLKGGKIFALNRHAAAALASADSVSYAYTVQQVIDLYRDAVGADVGPETIQSAKAKLEAANEAGCPLN